MKKMNLIIILIVACLTVASLSLLLVNTYYSQSNTIIVAVPYTDNKTEATSYAYLESCVELYEQQNEGVTVMLEKIPVEMYPEWLSTSFIYSEAPDIFAVEPSDFYMLSSMNALEDLSSLNLSHCISQNITDPWKMNGKQYAIPYETSPPCIVVNKNLLKNEYVSLHAAYFDWMDLFYIAKFFTYDSDGDGIFDYFGVTNINWESLVYANGQRLFDFESSNSFFNNHNVAFAIKYAIEMNRLNLSSLPDSFEKGRVVMQVTDLSQARYYLKHYPTLDLEIYPFPKGPDGFFLSEPYDSPLAINSRSKNKDIAKDFLAFLVLNPENQISLFNNSYGFPVLKEAQAATNLTAYVQEDILQKIISTETIAIDFPDYYKLMNVADKEIFQYVKYELDINSELHILNDTIISALKALRES